MSENPLIAVVDDDASMRGALRRLLRSVGFRAAEFASAEEFLQAGQLQDTACVIVDVRMPRMSGLELQQHLATIQCPVPLIFITAHGDDEVRARALRAGAVAFLDKPFREEVLLRAIQSALQASRDGGAGPRAETGHSSWSPRRAKKSTCPTAASLAQRSPLTHVSYPHRKLPLIDCKTRGCPARVLGTPVGPYALAQ
jgi:CheY-like chemotaxis protein